VAKLDRFQIGTFASQALLQPLDSFIRRDKWNMDEYYPATRDEAFYRGSYYGIPWNTDDRALYYNKDMFNDVGLDAERPPQTWEEVIEYSRKIDRIRPEGKIERATLVPHWGNWYFLGWLYTAGGDLLDPTNQTVIWNNEAGVRALEFMQERLQYYGGTAPLDEFNGAYPGGAFVGGGLAMMMDGSWASSGWLAGGLKFELGAGNPPRPAGLEGTPVTWSGGFALVIPTGVNSEQAEAGWEFIKFYTSEWAQKELGVGSGQIPSLRAAAVSRDFVRRDATIGKFVELMNHSCFRPVIPAGGELWSIYTDQIHSMLTADEMPARQILEETARLGQIKLDEGWARAIR